MTKKASQKELDLRMGLREGMLIRGHSNNTFYYFMNHKPTPHL